MKYLAAIALLLLPQIAHAGWADALAGAGAVANGMNNPPPGSYPYPPPPPVGYGFDYQHYQPNWYQQYALPNGQQWSCWTVGFQTYCH